MPLERARRPMQLGHDVAEVNDAASACPTL
jgi:hypothetical protein